MILLDKKLKYNYYNLLNILKNLLIFETIKIPFNLLEKEKIENFNDLTLQSKLDFLKLTENVKDDFLFKFLIKKQNIFFINIDLLKEEKELFFWYIESLKSLRLKIDFEEKEFYYKELFFNRIQLFDNTIDFVETQLLKDLKINKILNKKIEGIVIGFIDSIVIIEHLYDAKLNELIYFSGGATGLVLNLEYKLIKALVFDNSTSIVVGEIVKTSGFVMKIGVGYNLLGRIVDPLMRPLDGLQKIKFDTFNIMEKKAPGVIMRHKVSKSIITGIKVIDALIPIGKGQRELILGDRKTGKTTIAIDTILSQQELFENQIDFINCIYVAIGKRMSEIHQIVKVLKENNALSYTVIVVARASDPAALQFIAPYAGCSVAEFFTYKGKDSLIIYDDLTKHADVYRQISLLLRRPVGREAYPGDIFFLHSKLLERAVNLNGNYGGGSLTALPIIETIQGDVSAYIPTNVISITDGQIYLDLNKHQEGIRPAVDPGISVSRVGSAAQSNLMKKLAGSLKLNLAQYREIEQFSKFGSELDASTKFLLQKGKILVILLKQAKNLPLNLSTQLSILYLTIAPFFLNLIQNNLNFNIENYILNLIFFLKNSNIFFPFKFFLENRNIQKDFDLNWILHFHFKFYLFTEKFLVKKNDYANKIILFSNIFQKNWKKINDLLIKNNNSIKTFFSQKKSFELTLKTIEVFSKSFTL